jgi:hypothetical protein
MVNMAAKRAFAATSVGEWNPLWVAAAPIVQTRKYRPNPRPIAP